MLKLLVQLLKFLRGKLNVFECLGFDHFDILGESQSKHALFDAPHIGVDRANEGCLGVASETLLKQSSKLRRIVLDEFFVPIKISDHHA